MSDQVKVYKLTGVTVNLQGSIYFFELQIMNQLLENSLRTYGVTLVTSYLIRLFVQ